MSSPYLDPCLVSFHGPPLSRMTRGALSAASIGLIERRPDPAWGEQVQRYVVSVAARDPGDAVDRVRSIVESHGSYTGFSGRPAMADQPSG